MWRALGLFAAILAAGARADWRGGAPPALHETLTNEAEPRYGRHEEAAMLSTDAWSAVSALALALTLWVALAALI